MIIGFTLLGTIASNATVTSTPSPSPSVTTCPTTQANIKDPAFPDYRNTSFAAYTSRVKVVVNPDGSVKSVSIYETSGYAGADQATIQAALHSTYTPGSVNCQPVEGWYIFRANFNPD